MVVSRKSTRTSKLASEVDAHLLRVLRGLLEEGRVRDIGDGDALASGPGLVLWKVGTADEIAADRLLGAGRDGSFRAVGLEAERLLRGAVVEIELVDPGMRVSELSVRRLLAGC